ncbi:MAG: N-acetylglutaminylglutamine synthetase [Desulfobacterales bacterium]|jgi:GNAT-family acetyltransferase (TIGR03103 family)
MERTADFRERLERISSFTVRNEKRPQGPKADQMSANACINMGWGRIIFGHTFQSQKDLCAAMDREGAGQRDITFYLRDPHVLLAMGPERFFLDPSHTFRLWMHEYQPGRIRPGAFSIRRLHARKDAQAINRLYAARQMVRCDPDFLLAHKASRQRTYFVAESLANGEIIGTVTGVDHVAAFADPEQGASLWCLAVDPQTNAPGVGEALVRHLADHYLTRGRAYLDLSVLHDNTEAIALYEKIGFQRVPVFCVKRKNSINEDLYIGRSPTDRLNPYAGIIVKEARRRGIGVNVADAEHGYFDLTFGGRTVACRESLTELTSAVAMSRCDDKRVTRRILAGAGLKVPRQFKAGDRAHNREVLADLKRIVVKPARGEQGNGISVDLQTAEALESALRRARQYCPDVVLEEFIAGEDLRLIVIDNQMVAAAVRRPPVIVGTGQHTLRDLIKKYNRRRAAATDGEGRLPLDAETKRCLLLYGYRLDDVPPAEKEIPARKTANLHTGGTITDVTDEIHPELAAVGVKAAQALAIPVTGLDLIVPDLARPDYWIIEANERPGLANHEPQPTAQRFIDFLFPQTAAHTPNPSQERISP